MHLIILYPRHTLNSCIYAINIQNQSTACHFESMVFVAAQYRNSTRSISKFRFLPKKRLWGNFAYGMMANPRMIFIEIITILTNASSASSQVFDSPGLSGVVALWLNIIWLDYLQRFMKSDLLPSYGSWSDHKIVMTMELYGRIYLYLHRPILQQAHRVFHT